MFVALRHLNEQLPTGEVMRLAPGDEVQTFGSWPYVNQMAAIEQKMVAEMADNRSGAVNVARAAPPNPETKNGIRERAKASESGSEHLADAQGEGQPFSCASCKFVATSANGLKIHAARAHKKASA